VHQLEPDKNETPNRGPNRLGASSIILQNDDLFINTNYTQKYSDEEHYIEHFVNLPPSNSQNIPCIYPSGKDYASDIILPRYNECPDLTQTHSLRNQRLSTNFPHGKNFINSSNNLSTANTNILYCLVEKNHLENNFNAINESLHYQHMSITPPIYDFPISCLNNNNLLIQQEQKYPIFTSNFLNNYNVNSNREFGASILIPNFGQTQRYVDLTVEKTQNY
ncbi:hypothetical protein MXB_3372, partial [Myxobolus squamalis]